MLNISANAQTSDVKINNILKNIMINDLENNEVQKYFVYDNENIKLNLRKDFISKNYKKNQTITPEYIVIHETDNWSENADAEAHQYWWDNDPYANSSVHFVVDDKETIQLLPLDAFAYHVGDNINFSDIRNHNSIGIEICVNKDGNYEISRKRAILLTKYLMKTLDMSSESVVRHKDASNKNCPSIMIREPELWEDFKNRLDITFLYEDYLLELNTDAPTKYVSTYFDIKNPIFDIEPTRFVTNNKLAIII
jgi:probable enterotoxin D